MPLSRILLVGATSLGNASVILRNGVLPLLLNPIIAGNEKRREKLRSISDRIDGRLNKKKSVINNNHTKS